MDYSNSLLEHLQQLEEAQLNVQHEMTEKQNSLRQALAVCDSARSEAADLRRKLNISQVIVSRKH